MSREWRPAGLGRVLDDAFGLYRANARTVATVAVLVVFPVALVMGVAQVFYTRGLLALIPTIAESAGDLAGFETLTLLSLLANAVAPVLWVARVYVAAALLKAAGALLSERPPSVREVLAVGWRTGLTYAFSVFVLSLGATVLALFAIVPGVVFAARFGLAPAIVAVEGASFDTAFRRSWHLTSGHAWRVIGFFVLLSLFTTVLESAVTSPSIIRQVVVSLQNPEAIFQPVSPVWQTFEGMLSAASIALVLPFVEFAWFFFYADLRSRREGMDLVARAGRLRTRAASATLVLVVALVLVLATAVAPAYADAGDLEEYRERVSSARVTLEAYAASGAEEHPGEIVVGLLRAVPVSERVAVGDTEVVVDHSLFRTLLTRLDVARDPGARVGIAEEMAAHLAAIERSLPAAGAGSVPADPDALAALLDEARLSARSPLTEYLSELVDRLGRAFERWQAALSSTDGPRRVMAIGVAVVVAALAALLVWTLARLAVRLRQSTATRERPARAPAGQVPLIAAEESLPADALAYAESLARSGRFAEAVRALFGGAARSLAEAGHLTRTRTRTNAELLAEVGARIPAVSAPLTGLSGVFEGAVYGHLDPGASGYETARGHYDAVLGAIAGTPAPGSSAAGGGDAP